MPDSTPLNIRDVLDSKRVVLDLTGTSKREVLGSLVDALASTHRAIDKAALVDALMERETTSTTAIADGIAIPHGRHSVGEQVVCAFGRSVNGLEFNSVDGAPTRLFFLLVSPENNPTLHLRWLAHLCRLLRDPELRSALLGAETAEQVLERIEKAEQAQAQGTDGK